MKDTGLDSQFMEARPLLRRLLAARLGSAEDAEDALQDLWLRVAAMEGSHVEQPIPFFCRMATNLATDRRIAAARRSARDGAWEEVQPQSQEYADPERVVAGRRALERTHARIAEMPDRMRQAFTLFRFEELPQRLIAERMGITVSAVEKLLRRAYLFLQPNEAGQGADRAVPHRPVDERSADR